MKLFLGLIRIGGIAAEGESLMDEFINKQPDRFDVKRGYYAILKKKERGNIIPTISQINARHSARDENSDYIIAFLMTSDRRETAETFLNIFPNSKLDKEIVEFQVKDEWRMNQLSLCLSTSLTDLDFEIV